MIVKRIFVMLVMTATVAFSNAQQGPGGFYKIPSRQSVITTPLPAEQLVLQTDSVRWLKLTRMVMAGWKLDTVYKEGWYKLCVGGGSDPDGSIWGIYGANIEKRDSSLQLNIVQYSDGNYSSIYADNSMIELSTDDGNFKTPADSLVNDSTSKGESEIKSKAPLAGISTGQYISSGFGFNYLFMSSNGKMSMLGIDDAFKGAIVGSSEENANGRVNFGVKSKPIGVAYFTQIAASAISNPPYPTYPSATIDGRTGGGTAVQGAAGYQGTGVFGYQSGNYGQGIWGYSDVSYGVRANTVSGKALYATASGSGTAVYGLSESGLQFQFGYDKATPDDSTMVMLKSGHVGIGTTIPSTKLEVNGVITAMGGNSTYWNTSYSWGNHSGLYAPASTVSSQWESVTDFEGHYGIATDSNNVILKQGSLILGNYEPGQAQSIKFTGTGTDAFKIENTSDDDDLLRIYADDEKGIFLNQSSGYVGVGTTTMSEALTVNGNIHAQNIRYTAISENDHYGSGDIITLTASATMGIGDVVFVNSNGKTALCKADAIENCPYAFAICVSGSIGANEAGSFLTKGSLRDDSWNWTVGGLIYVSTTGTTGNTLTQTIPSGANNVIMPIGLALSADALYFFGNVNSVEKQ